MNVPDSSRRSGFSWGDLVLVLGALAVLVATVWPWMRRSAVLDHAQATVRAVDEARTAVLEYRAEEGSWPPAAEPGQVPQGLRAHLGWDASFRGEGWVMELRRWHSVERPPPPPAPDPEMVPPVQGAAAPPDTFELAEPRLVPLVGLEVETSDPTLLASLLEAFGPADSFVRDSTWTLVFPQEGPPDP